MLFLSFVLSNFSVAQVKNLQNNSPYPTKYLSAEDSHLTLKTLTVAPAYDNVGGIYQTTAENELIELISKDQFWAFSKFEWPVNIKKIEKRIDTVVEQPQTVLNILSASKANGLIVTIITKSAQGMNIHLSLYTEDKGLQLIELSHQDPTTFEIAKFKDIIKELYTQLKNKLPYKAFITSRRGNQITINAGANANLKTGDKLSVAQIIKINRHPKLKFMTGVEKEITGQIVLTKVEEFSSFGEIVFEKEGGVIEKNSKLLPPDFVQYQITEKLPEISGASSEKSAPEEWKPQATPQFGKLTILGGFSDYKLSSILSSSAAVNSGNSFAPTFLLGAELWVTSEYFARISLKQLFFKGNNALVGSTPDSLNFSVNNMDLLFGYKYSLNGNFWGPSFTGALGYLSESTKLTDTTPTAFSSFESSGLQIQVGGYFPVTEKSDIGIGLDAKFLLTQRLSESPLDSGSSSPSQNQFDIYGNYMYTSNINLKAEIIFSSINAGFNGAGNRTDPARSIDEKITSYLFGIEYLF